MVSLVTKTLFGTEEKGNSETPIDITLMADQSLVQLNLICYLLYCPGLKIIPEVRDQLRKLEARYAAIKQIRDIKEQLAGLKRAQVWAEVIDNEKV